MQIEYDPHKDALNLKKHGISLAEIVNMEWDTLWSFEDDRFSYGERRMMGFGYIGMRLYCVIYTELEDDTWRVGE